MTKVNKDSEKNNSHKHDKSEPAMQNETDPRSELGLKSPVREAVEGNEKPSQQDPEKGNRIDPRLKEPYGPTGYRSGLEDAEHPSKQNPGQVNPGHNTPGHPRRDQKGQQDPGEPGQGKTLSYPGIMGSKARALKENEAISKDEVNVEPGKK